MFKLCKKEFLENYSSHPNFHKKILKQGGVDTSKNSEIKKDFRVFYF